MQLLLQVMFCFLSLCPCLCCQKTARFNRHTAKLRKNQFWIKSEQAHNLSNKCLLSNCTLCSGTFGWFGPFCRVPYIKTVFSKITIFRWSVFLGMTGSLLLVPMLCYILYCPSICVCQQRWATWNLIFAGFQKFAFLLQLQFFVIPLLIFYPHAFQESHEIS